MRSIDLRVPAVAGFAVLLLAFAPGAKAAQYQEIQFVAGTGEVSTAAPTALANPAQDSRDAEAKLNDMAEDLADPRVQNGVADMVERMGESAVWRAGLLIGVLGGFTTFSTFSIETFNLIEQGAMAKAAANMAASLVLCVGATWLGVILARQI